MDITKEKLEMLAEYLGADENRAISLSAMSAEEACEKMNADGYAFTVEELAEIAKEVSYTAAPNSDELTEESLETVAGGGARLKILWWLVKNMPKALYIAWTAEPGKIRQKR